MYVMVTALAVLKPRKSLIHKYGNLKYGMFIFFFFCLNLVDKTGTRILVLNKDLGSNS